MTHHVHAGEAVCTICLLDQINKLTARVAALETRQRALARATLAATGRLLPPHCSVDGHDLLRAIAEGEDLP